MEKSYGLARLILALLAAIGVLSMGYGLYAAMSAVGRPAQSLALGIAASTVASGLLFLALAVLGLALLDMVENTAEIARLMKHDRANPPIHNTAPPISRQAKPAKTAQIYRDMEIEQRAYGFSVDGRPFNTIEEAREYVDKALAM